MRFGEFDADLATGELYRGGVKAKIQDLPFRVLAALLERGGGVVTREELRDRLWGAETFVDAEAGLNTAVAKLREALGDRAEAPRFIETLPKRGYRWIAPLEPAEVEASMPVPRAANRRLPMLALAVLALVALVTVAVRSWQPAERVTVAVVLFHNETGDPRFDGLAQQLTDATVVTLAANPRLAVIGNAAVLRTPRIFADIEKIAAALEADYLVLGQVQRPDAELVVRLHFVRARDQVHLWATSIASRPEELDQRVAAAVADGVTAALEGGQVGEPEPGR